MDVLERGQDVGAGPVDVCLESGLILRAGSAPKRQVQSRRRRDRIGGRMDRDGVHGVDVSQQVMRFQQPLHGFRVE